jgi:hypothetical protein
MILTSERANGGFVACNYEAKVAFQMFNWTLVGSMHPWGGNVLAKWQAVIVDGACRNTPIVNWKTFPTISPLTPTHRALRYCSNRNQPCTFSLGHER